jgi:outer membrane receptor protein involved in Fe transport
MDNSYNTTDALTINDNTIPKYIVVNMAATYDVTDKLKIFGAVDNVFDKDPPPIPSANFPVPEVAGSFYDKLGRYYRMGVTYEF